MEVSVVDRVNPSLALALTRRSEVVDLLLQAEARGSSSPGSPRRDGSSCTRWFAMRSSANYRGGRPTSGRSNILGAAQWFEGEGEVAFALEHYLLAGQPRSALRLLAANEALLYDSGRETTIRRAIAAIPDTVVTGDLEPMIDYAWCHLLVNRRRFLELVDEATWWASRSPVDQSLQARLTMLQSVAAQVSCDWAEAGRLARQILLALGDSWWRDPLGRFGWNAVARDVALSERWDETSDEVRETDFALKRDPQRRIASRGPAPGARAGGAASRRTSGGGWRPPCRGRWQHDDPAYRGGRRRGLGPPRAGVTAPGLSLSSRSWRRRRPRPCSTSRSWPQRPWSKRTWTRGQSVPPAGCSMKRETWSRGKRWRWGTQLARACRDTAGSGGGGRC